ncbi:16S rRNA (guanine(966)-N(2))-methyltransferase RsmD [Bacteroidales bacterium OttesenSCG-928-I21]|nr:16S rRNA (guanine(966)-N(2))-methyltransferase RsmD [Bacteroidales bacterium OttesenSCG-928-I21]
MRIIGGKYKGKTILPPSNFRARPTTDFAKESLFNILQNYFNFENVDVLDLFSGTGSISYEFCSRNCKSLIAVDNNHNHVKYIESQFEAMCFKQANVYKSDVFRFLKTCNKKFDIVFADPPYDFENIESIYDTVIENKLLSDTSLFIIEHSEKNDFSSFLHFMMLKKYGSVHFSFFDVEL